MPDRLHEFEVFVAVADAGSFAKAGARLRLSPPAVTRAVAALEGRLGARVFNRTTRSLTMTEVGQRLIGDARRILAEIDALERNAVGETAAAQGHLTVSASVTFGRMALTPIVADFLSAHPRVTASLVLTDRMVNLVEEGIDAAIRIGELPDSSLVARRIGAVRRVLVASPGYLVRREAPAAPPDLKRHAIIAFTGLMAGREWRFHTPQGAGAVALTPTLEVNDAVAAIDAAERGYGIANALSYMVNDAVEAGRLVLVLDGYAPPPRPVHLIYPQARLVAPKVRTFVDHAAPKLKAVLEQLG